MAREGWGELFGELPGGIRVYQAAAAHRAQRALVVVAAEQKSLGAAQGAGDGTDDGLGGVTATDRMS